MPRVKAIKKVINVTISSNNGEVAEPVVTTTIENGSISANVDGSADVGDVTAGKSKGRGKGKRGAVVKIAESVQPENNVEEIVETIKKPIIAKRRVIGGKKTADKAVVNFDVNVDADVDVDAADNEETAAKGKGRKKVATVTAIEAKNVVENVAAPMNKGRKRAIINYAELDESGTTTTNDSTPQIKKGRKKKEIATTVDTLPLKVSTPLVNKKRANTSSNTKKSASKSQTNPPEEVKTNGNGSENSFDEVATLKEGEQTVENEKLVNVSSGKVAKKRGRVPATKVDNVEEKDIKKKLKKESAPKTASKNKRENKVKATAAGVADKVSEIVPIDATVAAVQVDTSDDIKTAPDEEIAAAAIAKDDKKPRKRKPVALAAPLSTKSDIDHDDDDDGGDDNQSKVKSSKKSKKVTVNATTTVYNISDFELATSNGAVDCNEERYNLKISSWNVAGLRSWLKKDGLKFLEYEEPDILCLQEIKCTTDQLPEDAERINGYHPYWLCLPGGYAGVAIYSKIMPHHVEYGINNKEFDDAGRIITAEYEKFFLVNVYVPNSGRKLVNLEPRMRWEKLFQEHVKNLDARKPVIICGDMNVSHGEIDLANPKSNTRNAGFTKEEREKMSELLSLGFIDTFRDLYPKRTGAYTFWTYMGNARARNVGWRLDYFLVSERFKHRIVENCIRAQVLGSDHCPITLFAKI